MVVKPYGRFKVWEGGGGGEENILVILKEGGEGAEISDEGRMEMVKKRRNALIPNLDTFMWFL